MADQAEDEAAIRAAVEQVYATASKQDVKALLATATEDAETWGGGVKGHVALEKYFAELWERQKDVQYKILDEIGIVFVSPDVAIYKNRDEVAGELDADGNPIQPYKRLFALVFVKNNSRWLWTTWFSRTIEE
jgi:ketosteroid isomerase-like protein